jgi:uncharacterized damage-inducible protein DinB
MDFKAHATHLLGLSRRITEGVIAALKSEDDWFFQAHPTANFPLWIVGHLALADNMFVSRFRPQLATKPEGWDELFWFGSQHKSERSTYPPPEVVVAYFRERRQTLLKVLADVTEDELNGPAPPAGQRSPIAGAPCIGHLFLFAAAHESLHGGQLTIAHRGLGHPPLFG